MDMARAPPSPPGISETSPRCTPGDPLVSQNGSRFCLVNCAVFGIWLWNPFSMSPWRLPIWAVFGIWRWKPLLSVPLSLLSLLDLKARPLEEETRAEKRREGKRRERTEERIEDRR